MRFSIFRKQKGSSGSRHAGFQAGFTLVTTAVSLAIASIALFGGWIAFRDFQMQWRIANAERQMDQYAQNAMAELTNVLSWSYGIEQLSTGRNAVWRFALMEQAKEHAGPLGEGLLSYRYPTDQYYLLRQKNGGRVLLTHTADRGILFDRQEPQWAVSRRGNVSQYIWQGRNVRDPRDQLAAFDRRDRMQMTGFELDLPLEDDPYFDTSKPWDKHSVVQITITMQYRYNATSNNGVIGLFPEDYIRERTYTTKVLCRNWDVKENLFKDDIQGISQF
jgi:hypothetical protein